MQNKTLEHIKIEQSQEFDLRKQYSVEGPFDHGNIN